MSYQRTSHPCIQAIMCGHADTATYTIYSILIFLYIGFIVLITFLCMKVMRHPLIKTPRSIFHFLLLYLYVISMYVYFLGVFVEYSDTFYFTIQNIPGILFTGSLLIYLSSWAKFLILMEFKVVDTSKKAICKVDVLVSAYFCCVVILYIALSIIGLIKSILFVTSYLIISFSFAIITIILLHQLRRRFILIYHELKFQILLCNFTQSTVLILRSVYGLIATYANWPTEKQSKYGELFIRIVCELLPLIISVIIFQKAAARYVRESESSSFPLQRSRFKARDGWESLRDKTTIFLSIPEDQN